jgi:hypothetical protein
MDLIYTDENAVEQGYLTGYDLDMENGEENDFELITGREAWNYLRAGCYIYAESETEFGGKITRVAIDTNTETLKYYGLTWRGLLATRIIMPPSGQAYRLYTLSNNKSISDIMSDILTLTGFSDLFEVAETSGAVAYQFSRYVSVLDGFIGLCASNGRTLKCAYNPATQKIRLSAVLPVDYSSDDYSSYQFSFRIVKDYYPVNHIIALGSGELTARQVYHCYLQSDGTVGESAYYDVDVAEVYDYPNAESLDELKAGAKKRLLELQNTTKLEIALQDIDLQIGDTVSGTEELTGIVVTKTISGKILKMSATDYQISYKTGE